MLEHEALYTRKAGEEITGQMVSEREHERKTTGYEPSKTPGYEPLDTIGHAPLETTGYENLETTSYEPLGNLLETTGCERLSQIGDRKSPPCPYTQGQNWKVYIATFRLKSASRYKSHVGAVHYRGTSPIRKRPPLCHGPLAYFLEISASKSPGSILGMCLLWTRPDQRQVSAGNFVLEDVSKLY